MRIYFIKGDFMNIKILVVTHKKYWMPKIEMYLPIQVGLINKNDLGYLKDNTGDNISYKNPNYCELTAMYWAWKNIDVDYIGICHYRRYFTNKNKLKRFIIGKKNSILTEKEVEILLNKYDVILPKKNIFKESIKEQYAKNHKEKDLYIVENIIYKKYPQYMDIFYKVMNGNSGYFLNMFVMRKKVFNNYCKWLFSILFETERSINLKEYDTYQSRIFGFLSERLFNVWLEYQNLKSIELPVITIRKGN
ncbi:DUF4422 domain-containing protein [Megamonas funiformis]|uniref:DUF4422 domain-containing protein n=1 Tax=Megamonas funiformis TaxID=437897 RepID=UPI00388F4AB7